MVNIIRRARQTGNPQMGNSPGEVQTKTKKAMQRAIQGKGDNDSRTDRDQT